jgi:hypothetical protein
MVVIRVHKIHFTIKLPWKGQYSRCCQHPTPGSLKSAVECQRPSEAALDVTGDQQGFEPGHDREPQGYPCFGSLYIMR